MDSQTANMTDASTPSLYTLSIFLNGDILCEIDILMFILKLGAFSYCLLALFSLGQIGLRLFFKVVENLSAEVDDYLEGSGDHDNDHTHNNKSFNATDGNKNIATEDSERQSPATELPINISSIPFAPCSVCHTKLKALSPSSFETNPVVELLILDPVSSTNTIESNVAERKPMFYAEHALKSVVNDLEAFVARFTQAEAEDRLVELKSMRGDIGYRASMFMKPGDALIGRFNTHASWGYWGDVHLIDGLMWLLYKRFPGQLGDEKCMEGKNAKEDDTQDHKQDEEAKDAGLHQSPHDVSDSSARRDSPASSRRRVPLPNAQDIIFSATEGLYQQLKFLSPSEIDIILSKLRRKRRKIAERRHHIVDHSCLPGANAGYFERTKAEAEVEAHIAARIGLVDGIILAIRQRCESSHPALDEESHDSWSDFEHEPRGPSPTNSPRPEPDVPVWKAEIREWLNRPSEVSRMVRYN